MKRVRKPNPESLKRYVHKTLIINPERDPEVIVKLAKERCANEYILKLIREDIKKEQK